MKDDLISRQAAIDAVAKGLKGVFVEYQDVAEILLNNLPSAQPVRHGKWLCSDDMYETAVCSVCNCDTEEPYEYVKKSWNFCPNCGARMDAERKEECGHQ